MTARGRRREDCGVISSRGPIRRGRVGCWLARCACALRRGGRRRARSAGSRGRRERGAEASSGVLRRFISLSRYRRPGRSPLSIWEPQRPPPRPVPPHALGGALVSASLSWAGGRRVLGCRWRPSLAPGGRPGLVSAVGTSR